MTTRLIPKNFPLLKMQVIIKLLIKSIKSIIIKRVIPKVIVDDDVMIMLNKSNILSLNGIDALDNELFSYMCS